MFIIFFPYVLNTSLHFPLIDILNGIAFGKYLTLSNFSKMEFHLLIFQLFTLTYLIITLLNALLSFLTVLRGDLLLSLEIFHRM